MTESFGRSLKNWIEKEFKQLGYQPLRNEEYLIFESVDIAAFAVVHFSRTGPRPCTEVQYYVSSKTLMSLNKLSFSLAPKEFVGYIRWRATQLEPYGDQEFLPYPADLETFEALIAYLPRVIRKGEQAVRQFGLAPELLTFMLQHPENMMISADMLRFFEGRLEGQISQTSFKEWKSGGQE